MHINLKALMTKFSFTNEDMANYLKITTATFNRKVNGKNEFTISEIEKIKELFNLSYEAIFFSNDVLEKSTKTSA